MPNKTLALHISLITHFLPSPSSIAITIWNSHCGDMSLVSVGTCHTHSHSHHSLWGIPRSGANIQKELYKLVKEIYKPVFFTRHLLGTY